MLDNQVELRVEALLVRLYIHVGDRCPGSESESRIARARGGLAGEGIQTGSGWGRLARAGSTRSDGDQD